MKIKSMEEKIEMPDKVGARIDNHILTVKGPKGEVSKKIVNPRVSITINGNSIVVSAKNATKREKTTIGTFCAHIKNMIKGVTEGCTYILKICPGHFPMNVGVTGNQFIVKNFLGEKVPRVTNIVANTHVKVDGTNVVVESCSKEAAGQMAADIEKLCIITKRDRRVFQDGIYIINKSGKESK